MDTVIDIRIMRMHREAKGWDQLTLARKAGIDPSVVSRLERGLQIDLKASVLIALAQALDISVDMLIPDHPLTTSEYVTDLTAMVAEVERLPEKYQRQVAALLYGYLSTLPNEIVFQAKDNAGEVQK
jgi:transcriptional regulator with XRE-family HTH domain